MVYMFISFYSNVPTFGVVAYTFDLSIQEVEAGGSEAQGHPQLSDKFGSG